MAGWWRHVLGATTVALALAVSSCGLQQPNGHEPQPAPSTTPPTRSPAGPPTPTPSPTTHDETVSEYVRATASQRTFFAHQSVGHDILRGLNHLSRTNGWGNPVYVDLDKDEVVPDGPGGGLIARVKIGTDRDPLGKITEFDRRLREGLGGRVDIATLVFSSVDVETGTDVRAVFDTYHSVLAGLQRDFPEVAFIPATVPLTTDDVGGNTARTKFNKLVRKEYAEAGRLWDIAAIESTDPDGKRVGGKKHEALFPGYAVKTANLNETGSQAVAEGLLRVIAHAAWDDA